LKWTLILVNKNMCNLRTRFSIKFIWGLSPYIHLLKKKIIIVQ